MSISITSIEHGFSIAAHDVMVAAKAIEQAAAKIVGEAKVIEPIVNTLLAGNPAALALARVSEALLGQVCGAIAAAGEAAAAKGLNVNLDQTLMADVMAVYHALKGAPSVTAAPAAAVKAVIIPTK